MTERRYIYSTTLNWGGDTPTAEIEVTVSYSVAWGSPETGRYGPPEHYDPGSGDEVEDIKLELVEGKQRPWDMGYGHITDDDFATDCVEKIEGDKLHYEEMIAAAIEEDTAARDSYLEQERKDDRFEYGATDADDRDWF